ncbi:hypothetical protein KR222_002326 [Zaprionus bogoriensis]|nr:hypothetical protein KR222_002326 [Zaprionus bogoriensis]
MDAQFEHLCRICAANTKCKNNSVVESVFIFKTLGLNDKIGRHLYLNVAEDDPLPKVLCKSCYRQVEATASLSNIAKHTQRVFRDFLLSTVPKHARDTTAAMLHSSPVLSAPSGDTNEPNINNNDLRNQGSNSECDTFQPILLTRPKETTITLNTTPQTSIHSKYEDTLKSFANKSSDMSQEQNQQHIPTTGQHKSINSRNNVKISSLTLPTRRNSVFVDTRYSSAPMSIAQRSMQQPPTLTPINSEASLSNVNIKSPEKKKSPAGVINFIQTHGFITGNAPTITTRINRDNSHGAISSANNKNYQFTPEATDIVAAASTHCINVNSAGVPNLPSSVLQQKRRNLKNALNNISAIRDGQVSLLKSAHQRKTREDIDIRPLVTTTVVPHLSLYGSEPSVEEALPEHIIIAAPKKKKEELSTLACQGPPPLQKISAVNAKNAQSVSTPCDINKPTGVSRDAFKSKSPSNMSSLTDSISLGNVIRDTDLLKLILKALKWPVTSGNCEEQMAKLKSSKFAVIMSDNNLLQDTDLTQLLGPYLSPIMPVVQQQLSSTKIPSTSPASPLQATSELQTIGDCTMPFKLPPETSVQLVPSSPTDQEPQQYLSSKPLSSLKRPQRKSRGRDFHIDEQSSTTDSTPTSNAAHVTNELLNINAMLISQFGSNPADAINEALVSMLKQESKGQRSTRRSRSASTTSASLNLEDIVLVEPQSTPDAPLNPDFDVPTLKLPVAEKLSEAHSITRPIIKRRKGILQISEKNSTASTCKDIILIPKGIEDSVNNQTETESCKVLQDCGSTCDSSRPFEDSGSSHTLDASQAPTSTVPEVNPNSHVLTAQELHTATDNNTANTVKNISVKPTNIRKTDIKSDLGQKLLEAIGLPQPSNDLPSESSRDTLRSALKRSLKQAQEQQQQLKRVKHEEPVKQLADSTTKSAGGESSEEHKKAIAERELELLKRKTKNTEKHNLPFKNEKTERMDVSSSSSRTRRNVNKSKLDVHIEDLAVDKKNERWDEDDDLPLKSELEKSIEQINRPTRTSKTMSKYYKNPGTDKALSAHRSQHAMGTRSTRQR